MHQTLPATPTDRTVPGDGVRLHARDWGVADVTATPAVVLLHGLASNARIWDGVAQALRRPQSTGGLPLGSAWRPDAVAGASLLSPPDPRSTGGLPLGCAWRPDAVAGASLSSPPDPPSGLRVVALDLRGHGESEQPDGGYDFPTVARDVEIAMEALGVRRPVLAGHSWGANVALEVASSGSGAVELAGLVLIDGAFQSISEWPGMSRQAVRQRLAPPRFAVPLEDWLDQAGRWLPPGVDTAGGWVREFLRAGVEVDGDAVARARFHFDNHMRVIDALYDQRPPELYPAVTCPVLLCPAGGQMVHGKRDAVARAARLLPDARVVWFEDSLHDIPLQRPLALAAELARFVTEVGGRG